MRYAIKRISARAEYWLTGRYRTKRDARIGLSEKARAVKRDGGKAVLCGADSLKAMEKGGVVLYRIETIGPLRP